MTNTDQICSLSKLLKNKPTKNQKKNPSPNNWFLPSVQTVFQHLTFTDFLDEDLSTKYYFLQLSLPNLAAKQAAERAKPNAQPEGPHPPDAYTLTIRRLRLQLLPICRNHQEASTAFICGPFFLMKNTAEYKVSH